MLFFIKALATEGIDWELTLQAVKGHLEDLEELKKKGKLIFHGAILGKKGGIEIVRMDSSEELADLLNPMMPFFDIEVMPLINYEGTLKLVGKIEEKIPEIIPVKS